MKMKISAHNGEPGQDSTAVQSTFADFMDQNPGSVIFTVGFEGRGGIEELVRVLHANGIERVADVRKWAWSSATDFRKISLAKSLPAAKITYEHFPSLGSPGPCTKYYANNASTTHEAFREFYYGWVEEAVENDFNGLITYAEEEATVLMAAARYAEPARGQQVYCYRGYLADMLVDANFFEKWVDL